MPTSFVTVACLIAVISVSAAQAPPAPGPSLIRARVVTDEGGQPAELVSRQASLKDLESALASRKKTFVIADVESPADIVIDVVGRAIVVPKVVLGLGPRPGDPPGIAAGPVRNGVLRVRLTLGDLAADFTNKNRANDNPRGWKSAADDIASQIEKWVGQRRAEILRRRG